MFDQDELEAWEKDGVLELYTAFSRDQVRLSAVVIYRHLLIMFFAPFFKDKKSKEVIKLDDTRIRIRKVACSSCYAALFRAVIVA